MPPDHGPQGHRGRRPEAEGRRPLEAPEGVDRKENRPGFSRGTPKSFPWYLDWGDLYHYLSVSMTPGSFTLSHSIPLRLQYRMALGLAGLTITISRLSLVFHSTR